MERFARTVKLSKTGTTDHTQYATGPFASSGPGSKWLLIGASVMPQVTLAVDGTNYRSIDIQIGGNSVLTNLITNASTAFTAGTARYFTITGTGQALEVTPTAACSAVLGHAGTGGTLEADVELWFEVLP